MVMLNWVYLIQNLFLQEWSMLMSSIPNEDYGSGTLSLAEHMA